MKGPTTKQYAAIVYLSLCLPVSVFICVYIPIYLSVCSSASSWCPSCTMYQQLWWCWSEAFERNGHKFGLLFLNPNNIIIIKLTKVGSGEWIVILIFLILSFCCILIANCQLMLNIQYSAKLSSWTDFRFCSVKIQEKLLKMNGVYVHVGLNLTIPS